jgi:heme-degrading monooxygenase HmoA
VSLFDRVVDGEVVREVVAGLEEGAEGHALRFFAGGAGAVEEVPGLAEVVVLLKKESVLVQRSG